MSTRTGALSGSCRVLSISSGFRSVTGSWRGAFRDVHTALDFGFGQSDFRFDDEIDLDVSLLARYNMVEPVVPDMDMVFHAREVN